MSGGPVSSAASRRDPTNYGRQPKVDKAEAPLTFCHLLECAEIGEFYLSLTPHAVLMLAIGKIWRNRTA